ncbi:hypothetical protein ACJX0J_003277 (mitochondrion) [Zea mays]
MRSGSITGTKRNKAFLADELLPIFKKLPQVIEVTSHRYLFFLNDSIITRKQYSSIAVVLKTRDRMNRISQALLFLFLALSALISHVENSAHCDALDFIGNLLALLLTEEGIGLGTDREL